MSDRLDNFLELFKRDPGAMANHLVQAIHRIDALERDRCECGEGHHDPCGFRQRELENAEARAYNEGFKAGGRRRAEEIVVGCREKYLHADLLDVAGWIEREFGGMA